jgi:hypothetical protein
MIPFDEPWIHKIERQYGLKSKLEQPYIYHIATNAEMAGTRHLANRFVDSLPDKTQIKFIQKLRSGPSFSDAFHEVVVGEMLAQCGPLPQYETELAARKTPDWYLPPRSGQIACAVEVVSHNTQDGQGSPCLGELVLRLRQIPLGVVLNMASASEHVVLSSGDSKEITSNVWKWLGSASTVPDSKLQTGEFSFTLLPMQSGNDHVCIIEDFDAIRVDPRSLRSSVADKARKYTGVCQDSGTALVIAVVADVAAGSSLRSAESMLLGSVKGSVVFDRTTKRTLSARRYRAHDGIFEKYPGLGAVAWVMQNEPDMWTSTLFMNPACTLRLPDQVLTGLQSTMAIACET